MKSMKTSEIVSRNPRLMSGELVFAGTRVPVEVLIQHLAAGDPLEEFLDGFPTVSREQAVAYLWMTLEAIDALREREEASPSSERDARTAR